MQVFFKIKNLGEVKFSTDKKELFTYFKSELITFLCDQLLNNNNSRLLFWKNINYFLFFRYFLG